MNMVSIRRLPWVLIVGDTALFLLVTLIGFRSHNSLTPGSLSRMMATFVPFTASWFIVAPWLGLFDEPNLRTRAHLPRALFAAVLAAPLGSFLRGLWLGVPILPTFVLVMAGVSGLGMLIWRLIYQVLPRRSDHSN